MKKTNVIKFASLALLLGSFVGLANAFKNTEKVELFKESTELTEEFKDAGRAVALKNTPKKLASGDYLSSEVGVQISDVDENGNRAIRFIAQISSLDLDASFIRTMYAEDGTVFQSESKIDVRYAYESIQSGDQTVYPSEGYNYFIAYTLKNVPEAYWFHKLDVKVVVNEESEVETREANIEGCMPLDENLTYNSLTSIPSTTYATVREKITNAGFAASKLYQVAVNSSAKTTVESVTISKWYKTFEGNVATKVGPVIQTKASAFSGCTALKEVNFPNSEFFYYINSSSFNGCTSLENFTFVETLERIDSSALTGCTSLKNVYLNSKAIKSTSKVNVGNFDNLYLSKDVTHIPAGFFTGNIGVVHYSGTEEEWSTFKNTTYNSTNKVGIEKTNTGILNSVIVSSDTKKYDAIFHFEGASLVVNGVTYNDSYKYTDWNGVSVKDPGVPFVEDKVFGGWFANTQYEERLSSFGNLSSSGTLEYYAEFEDVRAGMGTNNPLTLNEGVNNSIITTWAMPHVYYSFVAEKSDYYYFEDVSSNDSSFISGGWLYDESMKVLASDNSSSDGNKFAINALLEAGKTYYLKAGHRVSSVSESGFVRGEVQVKVYTQEGDSIYEGVPFDANNVASGNKKTGINDYYDFTPDSEDEKYLRLNYFTIGGKNPTITVYNKEDGSVFDDSKILTTSTTSSVGKYIDYEFELNKTYVFEISCPGTGEYSFKLEPTPTGAIYDKPLEYTLGEEISSIDFTNNGKNHKSGSYSYNSIYYSFTAESSFDAVLNLNMTATNGLFVEIFKDGESIYTKGTMSSPYKPTTSGALAETISFVEGSEYIVNINARVSNITSYNTNTSFSLVPVIVNPDEGDGEVIESTSSLENPFEVEISEGFNYDSWGSLVANVPSYFKFSVEQWNYIKLGDKVTVKLYEVGSSNNLTLIYESSSAIDAIDLSDDGYALNGTYVLEVISTSDVESFRPWYTLY